MQTFQNFILKVVDIHAWTTCPSRRLRNGAACRSGHLGDSHYRRGLPPYPATGTGTGTAWTCAAGADGAGQVFLSQRPWLVWSSGWAATARISNKICSNNTQHVNCICFPNRSTFQLHRQTMWWRRVRTTGRGGVEARLGRDGISSQCFDSS